MFPVFLGQCWGSSSSWAQTPKRTNVSPDLPHFDQGLLHLHVNYLAFGICLWNIFCLCKASKSSCLVKELFQKMKMVFMYQCRQSHPVISPSFTFWTLQGEMKMPVCIEDECNSELPPASMLFRAGRQYAYGVLFSLAETHRRLERLALRKRAPLEGRS